MNPRIITYEEKEKLIASPGIPAKNIVSDDDMNEIKEVVNFNASFFEGKVNEHAEAIDELYARTVNVRDFGAKGDGITDDTAAIEATFNHAQTASKSVIFPAGNFIYNGSGVILTGRNWNVIGHARGTILRRTTNNPFFIYDYSASDGGSSYFGNMMFIGVNLPQNDRANAHGIFCRSNNGTHGLNNVIFENITGRGLESVIYFDKNQVLPSEQYTANMHALQFIGINAQRVIQTRCNYGIKFEAGCGSHNIFSDCILRTEKESVIIGDGVQGLGDMSFSNCHFLGVTTGLKIIGPLVQTIDGNPVYCRSISVVGGQFDGNTVNTFHFENINDWRVIGHNSKTGVQENIVNCNNYFYTKNRSETSTSLTPVREMYDEKRLTNPITFESVVALRRNVANSYLELYGGTTGGARIQLYGNTHTNSSRIAADCNEFRLRSNDGQTTRAVIDSGGLRLETHTWNGQLIRLANYRLWIDATGKLRIKDGAPTSDTDGTIVGTQS